MEKKPHSDNKFKQQDTPHFFTKHSAKTVISSLLITAIIFIPLGAAIVVASDSIFELDIRYDDVARYKYTTTCASAYSIPFNGTTTSQGCNTKKVFTIAKSVPQPISVSYRLVEFHQNYRQYATFVTTGNLQVRGLIQHRTATPFGCQVTQFNNSRRFQAPL